MSTDAILIENVSKHYDSIVAVEDVSLSVASGEVFGLIGHNGAGKSTLFKMMLGLVAPSSGHIRLHGTAVSGDQFREVRRRIAYLPENVVFYDNLTGLETLYFFADLKGAPRRECKPLLEKVGLTGAAKRKVGGYSKGMRQRLGFAQALLGKPDILFLDEPTTGLDPEAIRSFYQLLHELKEQGVTAMLSSHSLAEIQERVDRLALMKLGRIQAVGTVSSLRRQLGLPIHFVVGLQGEGESALRRLLDGYKEARLEVNGSTASVFCSIDQKLSLLSGLTSLHGVIDDIQVKEPSLEDVFLGYVDA